MYSGEYKSMIQMFSDHMYLFRSAMVEMSSYFLERETVGIYSWDNSEFREEIKAKLSDHPYMMLNEVYNSNKDTSFNGSKVDTVMRYIFIEAYGSAIYIDDVLYFKTEQDMLVFTLRFC